MSVASDETIDDLRLGGLKIIQGRKGYRFSLDPVLLCKFSEIRKGEEVLDLGTGSGVVPLLLAKTTEAARVVGVEVQPLLADRARRSVALNELAARVEIVGADLRVCRQIFAPQSFSVVLSNPPYRKVRMGRQAPQAERAQARHEICGGLEDFLRAAAYLLGDGGRFYIVYLAERLAELLAQMQKLHLEPKRMRCVHGRLGEPARMVLVEGRKGGRPGLGVEPPLVVFEGEGYSPEVWAIYRED